MLQGFISNIEEPFKKEAASISEKGLGAAALGAGGNALHGFAQGTEDLINGGAAFVRAVEPATTAGMVRQILHMKQPPALPRVDLTPQVEDAYGKQNTVDAQKDFPVSSGLAHMLGGIAPSLPAWMMGEGAAAVGGDALSAAAASPVGAKALSFAAKPLQAMGPMGDAMLQTAQKMGFMPDLAKIVAGGAGGVLTTTMQSNLAEQAKANNTQGQPDLGKAFTAGMEAVKEQMPWILGSAGLIKGAGAAFEKMQKDHQLRMVKQVDDEHQKLRDVKQAEHDRIMDGIVAETGRLSDANNRQAQIEELRFKQQLERHAQEQKWLQEEHGLAKQREQNTAANAATGQARQQMDVEAAQNRIAAHKEQQQALWDKQEAHWQEQEAQMNRQRGEVEASRQAAINARKPYQHPVEEAPPEPEPPPPAAPAPRGEKDRAPLSFTNRNRSNLDNQNTGAFAPEEAAIPEGASDAQAKLLEEFPWMAKYADDLNELTTKKKGKKKAPKYLMATVPGMPQILTAMENVVPHVKAFFKDPKEVYHRLKTLMGLATDYSHMRYMDEQLAHDWMDHWGDLDEATRGMKLPETAAEKEAMLKMRRASDEEIWNNLEFKDVRPDLKRFSARVNRIMKNMGEMFQSKYKQLEAAGLDKDKDGHLTRPARFLSEKYTECTGRDIRSGGAPADSNEASIAQKVANAFYRGIVTGNYHIHSLHVYDWLVVSPGYYGPGTIADATRLLGEKAVRDWAGSFSNKGIFGKMKEGAGPELWDKLINQPAEKAAAAIGNAVPLLKGKAKYVEGGVLENVKNAANRVASVLKIGEDSGVGGEKLLRALMDPDGAGKLLTPQELRRVRGQMMVHMMKTTNFSPLGVSNRNMYQRLGPMAKILQPFMGIMTTQSGLMYDFTTGIHECVAKGDWAGARQNLRGALMMTGAIAMVGGGTNALATTVGNRLDPVDTMKWRSFLRSCDFISQGLMGGRHPAHVELVEIPLVYTTWDSLTKMMEDLGHLSRPEHWKTSDKHTMGALTNVANILLDGMTIADTTSVSQLSKIGKAMGEAKQGYQMHSTHLKEIGGDEKVGEALPLQTDAWEKFWDVILPNSSAKASMIDFNHENLESAKHFAAWQYPSQAKFVRKQLKQAFDHSLTKDGRGIVTHVDEIKAEEVQGILERAHALHERYMMAHPDGPPEKPSKLRLTQT